MGFPCEAVTQLEREAGNNLNGSTRAGFFTLYNKFSLLTGHKHPLEFL